jgi:thiopurine S-methyltransferase
MSHEDWFARWREGRIAFHEGKPNGMLERHLARLGANKRVLVPLCGKSEDLAFLAARGHRVLGIELVEDAVRAFFDEHQLAADVTRRDALAIYTSGPITVIAGDVFAVDPNLAGPLDALYDRAALIALDAETRDRYVAHVKSLVEPGSPGLVITLEYDPARMEGPPFSVTEDEVRAKFDYVEFLEQLPDDRRDFAIEKGWSVVVK